MAEPLELSARYIDSGTYEGAMSVNRMNTELSELAPGVAFIEAFSNVVVFDTDAGLTLFDTSLEAFGQAVRRSLRSWSEAAVHSICFTHGHIDHVGGAQLFLEEAETNGAARPAIIGHRAIAQRYARYAATNSYNRIINQRQFSTMGGGLLGASDEQAWGPTQWISPTTTYVDTLDLSIGDLSLELHHARGETDDHTWAWIPKHRAVCTGDLITWVFPNAGNPQKVQRYPDEWAAALRAMAKNKPALLLPAHGLPIAGEARIQRVLDDTASALEALVTQTLALMNDGASLDRCIHEVRVPAALMSRPYLQPVYDQPEFIVRNIWRQYGGWYDGDPAHLLPPNKVAFAREVAALAGSADKLARRALAVADADLRLACQLVELAAAAAPEDRTVQGLRAEIFGRHRDSAASLMAKGIFHAAASEAQAVADAEPAD